MCFSYSFRSNLRLSPLVWTRSLGPVTIQKSLPGFIILFTGLYYHLRRDVMGNVSKRISQFTDLNIRDAIVGIGRDVIRRITQERPTWIDEAPNRM
jgi:hypothetical protein